MSQEPKNKEEGFMYKFASFIVDKRNLIFLIVAIGLVFSVFSRSWGTSRMTRRRPSRSRSRILTACKA